MIEELGLELFEGEDCEVYQRWIAEVKRRNAKKASESNNWVSNSTSFRISMLSIPCIRFTQLNILYGSRISDSSLSLMAVGDIGHDQIQSLYPECGIEDDLEYNIFDKDDFMFRITGHSDMLNDDIHTLYEIKTVMYLSAVKHEPKWYHIRQANFYAGVKELDEIVIQYVQRFNYDMLEWRFPFNEKVFKEVVRDGYTLYDSFKRNVSAPSHPGKWCDWCTNKRKCKDIEKYGTVVENVDI